MTQTSQYPTTALFGLVQQVATPHDFENFQNFEAVGLELFCEVHGTGMRTYPRVREILDDEYLTFPIVDFLPSAPVDVSEDICFDVEFSDLQAMVDSFLREEVPIVSGSLEDYAKGMFYRNMDEMYALVHEHTKDEKVYSFTLSFNCHDAHREVRAMVIDISGDAIDCGLVVMSDGLFQRRPTLSEISESLMESAVV